MKKIEEADLRDLIKALTDRNSRIREEARKIIENSEFNWDYLADKHVINTLINTLSDSDGLIRQCCRNSLVKIGTRAVPSLIEALSDKKKTKRWEAIKALSLIHDPSALNALVKAMNDKVFDVRWVAAEGLIALGKQSVVPVLRLLMTQPDSVSVREGVHHVLYALYVENQDEIIKPVLEALEHSEAELQVPWAAEKALKALN
jgi:HEAT repeat protein